MQRLLFIILSGIVGLTQFVPVINAQQKIIVKNPYENVDFNSVHFKANFHAHTTNSDGSEDPEVVVQGYHAGGYNILAITDHNHVTWPWIDFGIDAEELEMLPVPGNELSRHHHNLSLFNLYPYPVRERSTRNLRTSLQEVSENGGLNILAHPGRYWEPDDEKVPDNVVSDYIELFSEFEFLIGMEVHNQEDRYPGDRKLWDALLEEMMPGRPVWGFANDDSHQKLHIGLNQNRFPLDELTENAVREAMIEGRFYFSSVATHPENMRDSDKVPQLTGVYYDEVNNTLTIEAESNGLALDDNRFTWFSNRGEKAASGMTIDLDKTDGLTTYIRAEIRGDGGTAYTQPFGLIEKVEK